jgi:tellurite resistance-related uncharacterized protein
VMFTSLGPFDETTVPPALLRRDHSIALGRWALLRVLEGAARLVFHRGRAARWGGARDPAAARASPSAAR